MKLSEEPKDAFDKWEFLVNLSSFENEISFNTYHSFENSPPI